MLLQLGDSGPAVDALQQALLEAGIAPTGDGSTFGSATKVAVQQFQAKHNLPRADGTFDGIVGPRTWAALNGDDDPATGEPAIPAPDVSSMSPLMAAALELADAEWKKGVRELDGNRNRGVDVDGYLVGRHGDGKDLLCFATYAGPPTPSCGWCKGREPAPQCFGAPWCARFALWCVQGAALQLGAADPTVGAGDLAGASKWIRWASKIGHLVGTGRLVDAKPQAGDVMCISTPGHGHVMLCASIVDDKCSTREGNASNRVNAHWRDVQSISAWIRLA